MRLLAWWRTLAQGARGVMRSGEADDADRDELQHFFDETVAALIIEGMSRSDAERKARLQLGNSTGIREHVRASRWENAIATMLTDVRYALRMLRRSPMFTAVVTLVLALGIGAVTTIFSAGAAILYRPIPTTTEPSRLVGIDRVGREGQAGTQASYAYYTGLRDGTRTLSGIAAWGKADLTISTTGAGTTVFGNLVSGNYFDVLGVRPYLGRFFLPEEDQTPNMHPVVVVSYDFWRTALGADSAAIGSQVRLNGAPFTLVGVTPPSFNGVFAPIVASAWVPVMMIERIRPQGSLTSPGASWLWMFGRLQDGATRESVRADLTRLTALRIAEGVEPEWMTKYGDIRLISLTGLPDDAQRTMKAFSGVLLAVAILVLLIACVNVASMLSARALSRRHEMAVRVALGAARTRLVRQLLTETLVLFTLGAAAGVLLAIVGTWALERIPLPGNVPLSLELSPDWRVLVFALLVAAVTGVAFGLLPALQAANVDLQSRLRGDTRSGGARAGVISRTLVVGQLALSLTLLVTAGLLVRALMSGRNVDPGFDATGVATATFRAESWGYDAGRARVFFSSLRERMTRVSGVTDVALVDRLPLQLSNSSEAIVLDGAPVGRDGQPQRTSVATTLVDGDYFDVLQVPVVSGRAIERRDDERAARVAVVNETMARTHFGGSQAIGRTFTYHGDRVTIVGIARDAKYNSLTERTLAMAYLPVAQEWRNELSLLVRSGDASPASLARVRDAVREAVRALDPALPTPDVTSLSQAMSFVLLPQRAAAYITGAMGAVGLLLATVGLYGIISYGVSRRSRELGVRLALGAQARDVERLVVRDGMRLAAFGVAAGLALAVAASRLLVAYLYGVSPLDLPTFALTSLLFIAVAFVASWLPARRAARLDPLVVLRQE